MGLHGLLEGQINEDNVNNVRRVTSRHFRNKKMEYMKDKGDDLETDHKNKDISDCIERCK
jgi:hypothetical protein